MQARAVALAGALLALLASAHRHALTAEVEFYWLSQRKNLRSVFLVQRQHCDSVGALVLQFFARYCSRFGTQSHQCKLSSRVVEERALMRTRLSTLPYAVLGYWTCTCAFVCRAGSDGQQMGSQALLLATWPIALPFTQCEVTCMMFQLQRGCPGVCTACQAL